MKLRSFGKLFSLVAILALLFTCAMAISVSAAEGEQSEGGITITYEAGFKDECGKVKLSWDQVSGACKYVVYHNGEHIANSIANYYIVSGLDVANYGDDQAISHAFKVVAVDENDNVLCSGTIDEVSAEHVYTVVVTAPTCTEGGYTTHTCSCGDSYVDTPTEATGHTEGEPTTENNVLPTCKASGSYDTVVRCTVCQAELSKETTTVDPTGEHTWVGGTCQEPATCSVCGDAAPAPTGEHSWTDATCQAPKTCSVCGATEGDPIAHTGGTATCTEAAVCTVCGQSYGSTAEHRWSNATCDAPKTCQTCGLTNGSALGHSYSEADCTTAATCSKCGKKNGSALGHDFTEADCENASVCLRCNAEGDAALGHSFVEDTESDSFIVYEVCERCQTQGSFSKVQLPEKHKDTVIKVGVVAVCALVIILCLNAINRPATTTPWYKRRKYR